MAVVGLMGACQSFGSAGVAFEAWANVKGSKVSDLTESAAFRKRPSQARILPEFSMESFGDEYGARFSAIIRAPETGDYTFWIASDDSSELWLAPDKDPDNARKIASVSRYVSRRRWDARPSQKSEAIPLKKGQLFYLMALHKNSAGDDHLSVAWQGPSFGRRIVGDDSVRVPELSRATRLAIERARQTDKHLASLEGCMPGKVADYVASLNKAERKALAGEMVRVVERLKKKKLSAEERGRLRSFARVASELNPSEEHPITDPVLCSLLFLENTWLKSLSFDELVTIGPHRSANAFGPIPRSAQGETRSVTLNSKAGKQGSELVSTGLYALPGRPIQIQLPRQLAGKSLSVVIGHHRAPSMQERNLRLISMPDAQWQTPLSKSTMEAINPFGGLVFIRVPANVELDREKITIRGAVRAPRFVLERDSDQDWKNLREAPAPWGELVCDHLVMVVDAETLRTIDDPTALMSWWNATVRDHEGFYNHDRGMPFRMHTTHYARQGVSYWPLEWSKANVGKIVCTRKLKTYSDGLFLHEHGHHADNGKMIFGNIGESTPNWAGYYMKATRGDFVWKDTEETHLLALFDPNNKLHQQVREAGWWKTKHTHYWSYPMTSIVVGYAHTFGWEAFKKCVHRFTHDDDRVNNDSLFKTREGVGRDQTIIDKWLVFLSEEARHDVRPYLAHFKLEPSPEVNAYMDAMELPPWDLVHVPRCPVVVSKGESVRIPAPQLSALTFSGKLKCTAMGKPKGGTLERLKNGILTYYPRPDFSGLEMIPFTLVNAYGNEVKGTLEIHVLPEERNPHLAGGREVGAKVDQWISVRFPRAYRNPVFAAYIAGAKQANLKKVPPMVVRTRGLSADGCEIAVQRTGSGPDSAVCDVEWVVMETGSYAEAESGIVAEAFQQEINPENRGTTLQGLVTASLDGNIPMLRAARFGQVLTSNNNDWVDAYWQDVVSEGAIRFGCYGDADSNFRKKEMLGMLFIGQGRYQFGGSLVQVGENRISQLGDADRYAESLVKVAQNAMRN